MSKVDAVSEVGRGDSDLHLCQAEQWALGSGKARDRCLSRSSQSQYGRDGGMQTTMGWRARQVMGRGQVQGPEKGRGTEGREGREWTDPMGWKLSEEALWTPCRKGFLKDGQAGSGEKCSTGGSAHEWALGRNWGGFVFLGHRVDAVVGTWDCGRPVGHARTWASLCRLRGCGGCSGSQVASPHGSRCERAVRS